MARAQSFPDLRCFLGFFADEMKTVTLTSRACWLTSTKDVKKGVCFFSQTFQNIRSYFL